MHKLKNQKGFVVVEAILGILLLVAIGAAIYFAYHAGENKTAKASPASSTSSKTSTPAKPSAAPALASTSSAEQVVRQFYVAYIQAAQNGPQSALAAVINQYSTQNFITAYGQAKDFDPVFCGQQMPDQGISILSATASSASTVNVGISQNYSGASPLDNSVSVVSGKIDSIACPVH